MSNVYKKLAKARLELSQSGLKTSGKNVHMRYDYFELKDFIPTVNQIFHNTGLIGVFQFIAEDNKALLEIIDTEDQGKITFYSPIVDAGLKGGTAIQNLGAVQTYTRRYLWIQALELSESDQVNNQPKEALTPYDAITEQDISIIEGIKEEVDYIITTLDGDKDKQAELFTKINKINKESVKKKAKATVAKVFKESGFNYDSALMAYTKEAKKTNEFEAFMGAEQ
ncbi:erf superfamily [Caudoviricetes sp.]|nr:erf superfamily [Caudoviricetes sp.]